MGYSVLSGISIHAPTRGATTVLSCPAYYCKYFNPRSYKRSDESLKLMEKKRKFQSTLLQEERRDPANFELALFDFNPRSYKRSDPFIYLTWQSLYLFQSTLLQEERQGENAIALIAEDFNPRSYKRSDDGCNSSFRFTIISIHAPTRGATLASVFHCCIVVISIHAPTRGATHVCVRRHFLHFDFNPRSYKRSDFKRFYQFLQSFISIHAPTRGATAKMHNNPYTYL